MKKGNLIVTGIFALLLVFGFVLVACDNGTTPDDILYAAATTAKDGAIDASTTTSVKTQYPLNKDELDYKKDVLTKYKRMTTTTGTEQATATVAYTNLIKDGITNATKHLANEDIVLFKYLNDDIMEIIEDAIIAMAVPGANADVIYANAIGDVMAVNPAGMTTNNEWKALYAVMH